MCRISPVDPPANGESYEWAEMLQILNVMSLEVFECRDRHADLSRIVGEECADTQSAEIRLPTR